MSRLGAAVHVITTDGPSGKTGFTATAVCSVSDAPPTLLVCLNRAATSMPILRGNGVFCVNTLRAGDEILADIFAGRTKVAREARFDTGRMADARDRRAGADDAQWWRSTAGSSRSRPWRPTTFISAWSKRSISGPSGAALVYHDRAYKQV